MISEDSELRFRLIDLDGEANTEVNKESYYQIKYFIGCINLYFVCELLKTSSLVTLETYHYSNCIKIFEKKPTTGHNRTSMRHVKLSRKFHKVCHQPLVYANAC